MKLLLTPEEAADAIGSGRSTVYELMRAGQLESIKVGRNRRIPVDALERFVDQLRETAAAERDPRPVA